ncbi:N-terminal acetyltransferase A complex auxiliary subunit NAA15-like [Durio zibethinus]|uniref:N-terminal acetyltransferase A complex auxiliary subunit NAA15-like n=1 Tax=Durio zibethinus TaxID=66656 RepID=A0A6P5XJL6_DURZI|nr:N-terminal acetyltransferase A complex auxiliary subunit NAA15-like [Durio zibethinus]
MKKQRKVERAKKAEEKNEESSSSGISKCGKRHVKPTEYPLSEATKYLKLLQKNSPDSLETHLLSVEVNMRKQKILLAFQIKFFHKLGSMPAPLTDAEKLVWSVLEAERPSISQLQEKTLSEANKVFLGKHEESLMHIVAVAEMLYTLEQTKKLEAVK